MNKKQIFLIGVGRSGTTLVQRVLNTYPNNMIWGEHSGFLKKISSSYFDLKEGSSMKEYSYEKNPKGTITSIEGYKDPKVWQAWVNWFHPEDLAEIYRGFINDFFTPSNIGDDINIWGIKEIRYGHNDRVIEFLRELYPQAIFIFIVRDGLNNLESQLTTFYQGTSKWIKLKRIINLPTLIKVCISWKNSNRYYFNLSQKDKSGQLHLIKYEDLVRDPYLLQVPLKKIGLEFTEKQLAVFNMSEGRGTSFSEENSTDTRWKRLGYIPAFIAELIIGRAAKEIGYKCPKRLKIASWLSVFFRV